MHPTFHDCVAMQVKALDVELRAMSATDKRKFRDKVRREWEGEREGLGVLLLMRARHGSPQTNPKNRSRRPVATCCCSDGTSRRPRPRPRRSSSCSPAPRRRPAPAARCEGRGGVCIVLIFYFLGTRPLNPPILSILARAGDWRHRTVAKVSE